MFARRALNKDFSVRRPIPLATVLAAVMIGVTGCASSSDSAAHPASTCVSATSSTLRPTASPGYTEQADSLLHALAADSTTITSQGIDIVQWWVDSSTGQVEVALSYDSCPAGSLIPRSVVDQAQHFFDERYGAGRIFVTDTSAVMPQEQDQ